MLPFICRLCLIGFLLTILGCRRTETSLPPLTQPLPQPTAVPTNTLLPTQEPTAVPFNALLATQEAKYPAHYTAVAVQKNYAFLSHGKQLIVLFDVFDPGNMYNGWTKTLRNQINSVQVVGDYIYAGLGTPGANYYSSTDISEKLETGLQIIDITEFANSSRSSELPQTGFYNTDFDVFNVTVLDQVAYLTGNFIWEIVDISDVTAPAKIEIDLQSVHDLYHNGRFQVESGYRYWLDNICYRAACYGNFNIYDTSNPLEFTEIGHYESNLQYLDMAIRNNLVYLVARYHLHRYHFQILDISDPSHPIEVSNTQSLGGRQIALVDNFAYVISDRLQIIDIADPANPKLVHSLYPNTYLTDIVIENRHAFIVNWDTGLYILDISVPTNPILVNHFHRRGGW